MEPEQREPQWLVAFLRAINVGGHTVKMEDLKGHFKALALANVETFIASGNVIFNSSEPDHEALERTIEGRLQAELGYPVATFIRSAQKLTEIVNNLPFPAEEIERPDTSLYISFLASEPEVEAQEKLLALSSPVDSFHVRGREAYWLCRIRMSDSTFSGALLEKTLRMPATMRNITTVRKLAAKYSTRPPR